MTVWSRLPVPVDTRKALVTTFPTRPRHLSAARPPPAHRLGSFFASAAHHGALRRRRR